jgi:hypothetical protein
MLCGTNWTIHTTSALVIVSTVRIDAGKQQTEACEVLPFESS